MTISEYDKHEEQFLQEMANDLGLTGENIRIFLERFKNANTSKNNQQLALELDLGATTVRDYLKNSVYPKLKEKGFDWKQGKGSPKGQWKDARQWLRNEVFPKWFLTIEQLFKQIWEMGTTDDKRLYIKDLSGSGINKLDFNVPTQNKPRHTRIRLGSPFRYRLKLGNPGYLLLLEKFISGEVVCVCPSFLISESDFEAGELTI